jgi:hypothetical protein
MKYVIILVLISLLLQMLVVTMNWKSQMLMGNWVELIFLEFTLQYMFYLVTVAIKNKTTEDGK